MRSPRWLRPPAHESADEALRARVAHWVLVAGIVTLTLLLAALPAYDRDPYTLPVFGTSLAFGLLAFVILHLGYPRAAGMIAGSVAWVIVMLVSLTSGGVGSPQLATMVLVVMLIGFLWSSRAGLIAAAVTSVSILGVILADERGLLPEAGPDPEPAAVWGAITSVLAIAAVFLHLALRAIDDSRRALAQKSRELESEMERRSAAEESLRRAQKLEALGRLSGGIAHDFNNLLTVLLAQSRMLSDRAASRERLGEEASAEIRDIQVSAERAAALTRRLLGFARPPSGPTEDVDPAGALARLATVLRRVIPESIRLEIRPPPRPLAVRIDPGQFDQVILNLVLNARDAMPEGGALAIEGSEVELTPERAALQPGAVAGPHVRIAVSDTGPGIASEDRERIFDPFFTTKGLGHGTGLGLSTVHGIVTQAGGHVAIESGGGPGATLAVYLPSSPAAPTAEAPAAPAAAPRRRARGPATILLCEDEEPVRRIVEATLRDAGYEVLSAGVPERALELARDHDGNIALLLSDVVMPEMSGPALAEMLRAERGGLPVLLVTGYASASVADGGEGPTELLEKPFTADELLERVASLLEGPAPWEEAGAGAGGRLRERGPAA